MESLLAFCWICALCHCAKLQANKARMSKGTNWIWCYRALFLSEIKRKSNGFKKKSKGNRRDQKGIKRNQKDIKRKSKGTRKKSKEIKKNRKEIKRNGITRKSKEIKKNQREIKRKSTGFKRKSKGHQKESERKGNQSCTIYQSQKTFAFGPRPGLWRHSDVRTTDGAMPTNAYSRFQFIQQISPIFRMPCTI